MTVREYIGARYVPLFIGEWDNTNTYEPLSIVMYQGNSYTSRQYVPTGVEITNNEYWAVTGNYNAQIELYREEVVACENHIDTVEETLDGRIDTVEETLEGQITTVEETLEGQITTVEETLDGRIDTVEETLDGRIDALEEFTENIIFNSVSDMSASDELSEGMICVTNGYYSEGDGGAAIYKIVSSATPNNIDIIECASSNVYAVLIDGSIKYASQYGCIGETNINKINRVIEVGSDIVFDAQITTENTIEIPNGKKVKFSKLTYTGINYAIKTTGTGTVIEFDAIAANNGYGIFVNCNEMHFNTSKISGRVISSKEICLYIECKNYGCIWSNFSFIRLASSENYCIYMLCKSGDSDEQVSFIGQCNFDVNQMSAPNNFAVKAIAETSNSTITGVHFGNTAVENSKGGFHIGTEGVGSNSSVKMFEIESCRIYEGGYTLPVIKFVGNSFDNSITVDTPISLAFIDFDEVTANLMGRSNEIHGGISSPTGGVFCETAYCTGGYIFFDDIFEQYALNSGANRTLFDSSSTAVQNWRCHKIYFNDQGHNATIQNINYIVKNNTIFVSQNYSNSSTFTLIDNKGTTIFDGANISASGRKWYEIGRQGLNSYWIKEINPLINYS